MNSLPHGGGYMRAWVAYVCFENNLGSQLLGVRAQLEDAKLLAQSHRTHMIAEADLGMETSRKLEWSDFEDHQSKGVQSIHSDCTYYVEAQEFELIPEGDERATNISYLDLQVLRLTIENGRIAQLLVDLNKELTELRRLHGTR